MKKLYATLIAVTSLSGCAAPVAQQSDYDLCSIMSGYAGMNAYQYKDARLEMTKRISAGTSSLSMDQCITISSMAAKQSQNAAQALQNQVATQQAIDAMNAPKTYNVNVHQY